MLIVMVDKSRVDPSDVVSVAHCPHGMSISVALVVAATVELTIDSREVDEQSADSRLELHVSGWKTIESRTRG